MVLEKSGIQIRTARALPAPFLFVQKLEAVGEASSYPEVRDLRDDRDMIIQRILELKINGHASQRHYTHCGRNPDAVLSGISYIVRQPVRVLSVIFIVRVLGFI